MFCKINISISSLFLWSTSYETQKLISYTFFFFWFLLDGKTICHPCSGILFFLKITVCLHLLISNSIIHFKSHSTIFFSSVSVHFFCLELHRQSCVHVMVAILRSWSFFLAFSIFDLVDVINLHFYKCIFLLLFFKPNKVHQSITFINWTRGLSLPTQLFNGNRRSSFLRHKTFHKPLFRFSTFLIRFHQLFRIFIWK